MDNQRLIDANRLSAVLSNIDIAPTVDPVRHGHVVWRERPFTGPKYQSGTCLKCGQSSVFTVPPVEHDMMPYCSECGARLSDDFQDYCPRCGAALDGPSAMSVEIRQSEADRIKQILDNEQY